MRSVNIPVSEVSESEGGHKLWACSMAEQLDGLEIGVSGRHDLDRSLTMLDFSTDLLCICNK